MSSPTIGAYGVLLDGTAGLWKVTAINNDCITVEFCINRKVSSINQTIETTASNFWCLIDSL